MITPDIILWLGKGLLHMVDPTHYHASLYVHLITSLGNQILKHFCLPKAGLSFIINMEDCWEEIISTIVKHKNKLFKRTTKTKNQICLNCWAFHSQDYKQGGKTEEPTELSK